MITLEQLPIVAIPSMNDTHLEETLIINRLDEAARKGDIKAVPEILNELLAHTEIHFATEEELMKKSEFPAYQTHKSEHDRHLHELRSIIRYFGEHQDCRAIYTYIEGNLETWLVHHIETMDTITAQFVQQSATTD